MCGDPEINHIHMRSLTGNIRKKVKVCVIGESDRPYAQAVLFDRDCW